MDRTIARDYKRHKAERKMSWLRFVLQLQNGKPDIEFDVESQIPIKNKGHT